MVSLAVVFALWVWALSAGQRLTWAHIISQVEWLLFLPGLWLLLAALNNFYNLRLASRLGSNGVTLLRISALLLLIYLVIYFFSPPCPLPRGIVVYHAVSSFVLVGLWRAA